MSLRRLNRRVKPLAEKGRPGAIARHMSLRVGRDGHLWEFHATKGYKRRAKYLRVPQAAA